jgi:ABC-type nitrate/sulfonate/bicarbonate transport system substrate-binding protein
MKRAALLLAIFLGVFVLGCAQEKSVEPTPTLTLTPTPTPTPTPIPTATPAETYEEELLNVTLDDLAEIESMLDDLNELEDIQFNI